MSISNDDALEIERRILEEAFPSCDGDVVCIEEAITAIWAQTELGKPETFAPQNVLRDNQKV